LTGCEYGDRDVSYCSERQSRDCYDVNVRQTCCAWCAAGRDSQAPADCQFGDKASWCEPPELAPHGCYSAADTCCDTCATYRTGPPGKPATSVPLSCTAVATITLLWFYVAVTVWFRPSCISCIFHINLFFIFWFLQFSFCCLLFHGGQFNGLVAFLVTVKWIWWMMMVVMILANADLLTFSSPTCYRYFKILYTVTRNPQIVLLLEIQGRV